MCKGADETPDAIYSDGLLVSRSANDLINVGKDDKCRTFINVSTECGPHSNNSSLQP